MPRTYVEFGEWLPDIQDFSKPGLRRCFGVFPKSSSYQPFNKLATFSTNTLLQRCQGAIVATDLNSTSYNFAGDSSALYRMVSTTFVDVTRATGAYKTPATATWEFAQFGDNLYAVNSNPFGPAFPTSNGDKLQVMSLSTSTVFANLSPDPGIAAATITTIRDFVVVGNVQHLTSSSGTYAQRVRWCAVNNPFSWTPSASTMADYQDLAGPGGPIMKIIGGEYGVVFQRNAIQRMDFVGTPLIFQFNVMQNNLGTIAKNSVVSYQNMAFFLSDDGFYAFDGTQVIPIGRGKVDDSFWKGNLADIQVNKTLLHRINAEIDPENKLVLWSYPNTSSSDNPNVILVYSWAYNRWSALTGIDIEFLTRQISAGGATTLAVFNNVHGLSRFTGSQDSALFALAELQFNQDGLSTVVEARPHFETSGTAVSAVVTCFVRNTLQSGFTAADSAVINSRGVAKMRATSRYHLMRIDFPPGGTIYHIYGIEIEYQKHGVR